jgi:hypothetical protein
MAYCEGRCYPPPVPVNPDRLSCESAQINKNIGTRQTKYSSKPGKA